MEIKIDKNFYNKVACKILKMEWRCKSNWKCKDSVKRKNLFDRVGETRFEGNSILQEDQGKVNVNIKLWF